MDVAAKLTVMFSVVGAIAGIISGFMPNPWYSLLIAFILVYASYKLTTYRLKKSAAGVPGEKTVAGLPVEKKKVNLKNFGLFFATLTTKKETDEKETEVRFWLSSYYIMWLILWIMVYTIKLTFT